MDNFLLLSVLLSICALVKGHEQTDDIDYSVTSESITSTDGPDVLTPTSFSIGGIIFLALVICTIYYCCCRKERTQGFILFSNENENQNGGHSRRRRWRRFRGNRNQNRAQNAPEVPPQQHTTVIIQPVITQGIPDQNSGNPVSGMPSAPPAYNESMNNPPMPNQFMNPPMPNQFMNPPMQNQFVNPHIPNQFMNPPMPNQFANPHMPNQFINPPMPNNFNIPSNLNNLPPNPNKDPRYTKH